MHTLLKTSPVMAKSHTNQLDGCLFFSANSLARSVTRMADECFAPLAMSTSHAFLLMIAVEQPDITQKALAERLHLAQSTVSRFADTLQHRGLIRKNPEGKNVRIRATKEGKKLLPKIQAAWKQLGEDVSGILGEEPARKLARKTHKAHLKLANSRTPAHHHPA